MSQTPPPTEKEEQERITTDFSRSRHEKNTPFFSNRTLRSKGGGTERPFGNQQFHFFRFSLKQFSHELVNFRCIASAAGGQRRKLMDYCLWETPSLLCYHLSQKGSADHLAPKDDEVKPSSNSSTYDATTLFSPFSLSRAVVSWVMLPTPTTQFPCPPNCCGKCLQVITLGKGGHGGSSKRSVGHSTHRKRWLNRCSKFAPVTTTRNPAGQKNISIGPSSIFLFCGKREKTKWSVFSGGGWGRGPRDNKQRALALSLVGGITQNKNSSDDDVQWLLLSLRRTRRRRGGANPMVLCQQEEEVSCL